MSSFHFDLAGAKPPTADELRIEKCRMRRVAMVMDFFGPLCLVSAIACLLLLDDVIPDLLSGLLAVILIACIFKGFGIQARLRFKAEVLDELSDYGHQSAAAYAKESTMCEHYYQAVNAQGRALVMAELSAFRQLTERNPQNAIPYPILVS